LKNRGEKGACGIIMQGADAKQAELRDSTRRRRSQSRPRRSVSADILAQQLPWSQPQWSDQPTQPLHEEQLEALHQASLTVLKETGILFLNEEALSILVQAGCSVDQASSLVRFDPQFITDRLARAPASFEIVPRNPEKRLVWGGRYFNFGQVGSAPNIQDSNGRRPGTRAEYRDFIKLSQAFNCIHFLSGYPVEPQDIHASVRHLHCLYDKLTLSDKVVHGYSLGPERIEDVMEMVRIAGGLSDAEFAAKPRMFTNINSSSPLKHDWPMLDGAMRMARKGQPVVIAPFTLAGAMAPVTISGALVQQNAEALAAIALLQEINPGTPVVYGAFTSNVDMKSGAPAFGTPEYVRAAQISGQLARRYQLPWRSSNANAANVPDGQAAWESVFSLFGCMTGQANVIYHSAGWLEGGLSASKSKFVMDCEILQQLIALQEALPASADDLAVEAIAEVGPHGHFFGAEHTQSRYKTAFYTPFLSDWRNYESWQEAGGLWVHERAEKMAQQIIADFTPPPLDAAIEEELQAFVARRVEEGGAPTDF
jgi:trimethylamine--corrinoid protein Co-methyltransferase